MRAEASVLIAVVAASPAIAGCVCICEDGRNRAVCDNPADLPPVCAPRACAAERPAITPLPGPTLRSLGKASCAPARVYDEATGSFQWVRLCN